MICFLHKSSSLEAANQGVDTGQGPRLTLKKSLPSASGSGNLTNYGGTLYCYPEESFGAEEYSTSDMDAEKMMMSILLHKNGAATKAFPYK